MASQSCLDDPPNAALRACLFQQSPPNNQKGNSLWFFSLYVVCVQPMMGSDTCAPRHIGKPDTLRFPF